MMSMRKELSSGDTWPRACDTCGSAPCRVYCTADGYLCNHCDAHIHAVNQVASRHNRVSVCEGCERCPAEFLCKADAASLCAACDCDIHSANPLSRRHHRVPVLPLSTPGSKTAATAEPENEFDEAASWLLLNTSTNADNKSKKNNSPNGYFLGNEVDEYLDLVEYTSGSAENLQHEPHFDSVVPSGIAESKDSHEQLPYQMSLDFDIKSKPRRRALKLLWIEKNSSASTNIIREMAVNPTISECNMTPDVVVVMAGDDMPTYIAKPP